MGTPERKEEKTAKELEMEKVRIAQERKISETLLANCFTDRRCSPQSSAEIINEARPFAVEFTPKKTPEEMDEELNGKREPEPGNYYDTMETAFKD